MEKFCPKCGTKAPDNQSLFCNKCGTQLPVSQPEKQDKICPNCGGEILDKESIFCARCGSSISAPLPSIVKFKTSDKAFCPKCGAELKNPEAEICPTCGVRIKGVVKPPGTNPCGCNTIFGIIFVLLSLPCFSLVLSNPETYGYYIVGGLLFLGGGIYFFAKSYGWL